MQSYLYNLSHCVYIDGELSDTIESDVGVPQGSILGGLLYVLLVGDLPEVVHEHDQVTQQEEDNEKESQHCRKCGGLTAFVDDSTYQASAANPEELSDKLTKEYRKLASYMGDTGLVINDEKTHLIVMGGNKSSKNTTWSRLKQEQ